MIPKSHKVNGSGDGSGTFSTGRYQFLVVAPLPRIDSLTNNDISHGNPSRLVAK